MQFIHEIIQLTCVLFHYGKFRLGICFKCVTKIIFGSLELVCFWFFPPPPWAPKGEKWCAAARADRWSCWYVFSALLHKQISPVIYQRGKGEEGVSSSATAVVWMIERSDVVPVMNEMVGKAGKGEGGGTVGLACKSQDHWEKREHVPRWDTL